MASNHVDLQELVLSMVDTYNAQNGFVPTGVIVSFKNVTWSHQLGRVLSETPACSTLVEYFDDDGNPSGQHVFEEHFKMNINMHQSFMTNTANYKTFLDITLKDELRLNSGFPEKIKVAHIGSDVVEKYERVPIPNDCKSIDYETRKVTKDFTIKTFFKGDVKVRQTNQHYQFPDMQFSVTSILKANDLLHQPGGFFESRGTAEIEIKRQKKK